MRPSNTMTDDRTPPPVDPSLPYPSPGLQRLDRLVGTWQVSGPEIEGEVIYEWMEGRHFLVQRFDLVHAGRPTTGIEIIGHLRRFGEAPSADLHSRVYDTAGNTLDYVYEVDGDTLTIWGGERGSPAYYRGTFSADGDTNAGAWVYPGGGYESTMKRVG